jgi:hypothetical protein
MLLNALNVKIPLEPSPAPPPDDGTLAHARLEHSIPIQRLPAR